MSSPLPAKRRRLNDATTTLSRPFRSPLKTATSTNAPKTPHHDASTAIDTPYKKSALSFQTPNTFTTPSRSQDPASSPNSTQEQVQHAGPKTTPFPHRTLHATTHFTDPTTTSLEHSVRALESQIRDLRRDISTLTQASDIQKQQQPSPQSLSQASSTNPASTNASTATDTSTLDQDSTVDTVSLDLPSLIQKWRACAQNLATEIYPTVKSKIEDAGGVKVVMPRSSRVSDSSRNGLRSGEGRQTSRSGNGNNGRGRRVWGSSNTLQQNDQREEEEMETEKWLKGLADKEFDERGERIGDAEREVRLSEVEAWRKTNKERKERVEERENEAKEAEADAEAEADEDEDDDDEGFTMGMMLESLNVEKGVIGWDEETEAWVT